MLTIDARGSHGFMESLALVGRRKSIDISTNEIMLVIINPLRNSRLFRELGKAWAVKFLIL